MGAEDRGSLAGGGFSSNSATYAQRQVAQETLKATQEELASKVRELQVYEANYLQLKKDVTRWKKKFEYIFHENELLSLETSKLDASHKQIAFLQQEIKFKEEEASALRGLVSALEASNKKARASRLESAARLAGRKDQASAVLSNSATNESAAVAASGSSSEDLNALRETLERERKEHAMDKERYAAEIATLKSENSMLLKDLDRKELSLQLKDDKVNMHKDRISSLEQSLQQEQDSHLEKLREKQDQIADLEVQLQQMQMRRRSSAAALAAALERVEENDETFGPTDRLRPKSPEGEEEELNSDEDSDPDTPPGTPPPISAGALLPPDDPTADQIFRDWETDRKVRALASIELEEERLHTLIEKLPYEAKNGVSRILLDAVYPEPDHQIASEAQIIIRAVNKDMQQEFKTYLVPLLKAQRNLRVKYATMQRRTLVTDVRLTLHPRPLSCTGGLQPGEKRFGNGHAFLGPSADDVAKLVLHTARALSTQNKAIYVSKPEAEVKAPGAEHGDVDHTHPASPFRNSAEDAEAEAAAAGAAPVVEDAATASSRRWRGMSVTGALSTAKIMGTMVAVTKLRAKFVNTKHSHEGTSCQFCKMSPIVGQRYSCTTCVGIDLCETCYSLGGHGMENSDELFYRVQEIVLTRCPSLAEEVDLLELMRFEICRSNLRKFSFCLNWLADIINGKSSRDLQARALEIPSIRRDVRKKFVPLLMTVCSDRTDIEVKTEWELEDDNAAEVRSVVRGSLSEGDGRFLETLRIWVADQYRTTSPFVERSLLKFREGMAVEEEDEEAERDSAEPLGTPVGRASSAVAAEGLTFNEPTTPAKPPLARRREPTMIKHEEEEEESFATTGKKETIERGRIFSQSQEF